MIDTLIAIALYWMAAAIPLGWLLGKAIKKGEGPTACAHGCVGLCPDMALV